MAAHAGGRDSYVLFELAGATYAVRSDEIQQLEMIGQITPVPSAAGFVEGVVSIRGQVIPAINLRARFGFPRAPHDVRSRLIVARAHGRTIGLIVDSAREFAAIPPDLIQPPPEDVAGGGSYLRGTAHLGERLVFVLDVGDLLHVDPSRMPASGDAAAVI